MLTVEQLFEAYQDEDTDFVRDIYEWFGQEEGIGADAFAEKYSEYIPTYDPMGEKLAYEDKYLSYRNAAAVHNLSKKSTDEVFSKELEKVSGGVKKEMGAADQMAGQMGLRSGSLEDALESTLASAASDVKHLSDRTMLQKESDLNAYNVKMTDATLDYDKSVHDQKREFYDRVMDMVGKLAEQDAFDACPKGQVRCGDGSCADNAHNCPGYTDICGDENGIATSLEQCEGYIGEDSLRETCQSFCANKQGVGSAGLSCEEICMGYDDGAGNLNLDTHDLSNDLYDWFLGERDFMDAQEDCRDDDGNWICPDTPEQCPEGEEYKMFNRVWTCVPIGD
jgi:hypothetical protein